MSLQVWLPLNGDTHQQGVSGKKFSGTPGSWGGVVYATFAGNTGTVIYNNSTDWNYTDQFSYCFWIKPNYTGTAVQYAWTCGRADAGGYGYGCQVNNASTIQVIFGTHRISISVTANEWAHIACTINGTIMTAYKNGAKVGTTTISTRPTYSDGNGLGIGCFHFSSNIYPFYGSIRDLRIYDNVLSPKEIYHISRGLFIHLPLEGFYLSDLNKTKVYDTSGFENHGTINGSLKYTSDTLRNQQGMNNTADTSSGKGTDFIQISRNISTLLSQFTITGWVKQASGGGYSTIMSNSRFLGTCGLWLAINTESHGLWAYRAAYLSYGSDPTIPLNTWYHFAFTFNAGKVQAFLNGKAVSSVTDWTYQGTTIDLSNIYIFNSYTNTYWDTHFTGSLSDIRLYTSILSVNDLLELYQKPIHITNNGTLMIQGQFVES